MYVFVDTMRDFSLFYAISLFKLSFLINYVYRWTWLTTGMTIIQRTEENSSNPLLELIREFYRPHP